MQRMKFFTVPPRFPRSQPLLILSIVCTYFSIEISALAAAPMLAPDILVDRHSSSATIRSRSLLIAGADNFNPDLTLPLPRANIKLPPPEANFSKEVVPFAVLEELQTNIHHDREHTSQVNQIIEETAIFRLNNNERVSITTGFNRYEQPGARTITNIPVGINWETKINALKVRPGVGVDILNGAVNPNFNLQVDYPIMTGLTVSADIQQGAYKANAKTIENNISALRYGPSLYWQIDQDTSLFSSLHRGSYSDRNQEQQSFSRIEHKFDEFSVAGNLFTWNYQNPTDKGYFAPSDFLVYTGEVAWQGSVVKDFLNCRLSIELGGQIFNTQSSGAGSYQSKCTAKISPNLEADFGYKFSNITSQESGASLANNQSITGQIRWKF
jgi:hypothetical protein